MNTYKNWKINCEYGRIEWKRAKAKREDKMQREREKDREKEREKRERELTGKMGGNKEKYWDGNVNRGGERRIEGEGLCNRDGKRGYGGSSWTCLCITGIMYKTEHLLDREEGQLWVYKHTCVIWLHFCYYWCFWYALNVHFFKINRLVCNPQESIWSHACKSRKHVLQSQSCGFFLCEQIHSNRKQFVTVAVPWCCMSLRLFWRRYWWFASAFKSRISCCHLIHHLMLYCFIAS